MKLLTSKKSDHWRSLLFIPANKQKFIDSAATRGADAIILDLEDSIPQQEKPNARAQLFQQITLLHEQQQDVLVRINVDLINAVADLQAAVTPFTSAIIIPKVIGPDHIRLIDDTIAQLEQENNIELGSIKLIAQIECLASLEKANAIAVSSPRLIGLSLGTEDLALDGGFEPNSENLYLPCQKLIYAARLAKIATYGFAGSIADFSDIEHFTQLQHKAKSMGFNGALCIHPSQVAPINNAHAPSEDEVTLANEIVKAYEQALTENSAVVQVQGKMIDLPVVERARKVLALIDKSI